MNHSWKTSFAAVWFAQLCGMIGFSLALPFAPFYIQALGVAEPAAIKWWASVCQSITGISIAAMAPVWGILADRFGRKSMLMRAQFCAVIVLAGMAFSPNVQVFFIMRLLQGVFTGTMSAATTFVSSIAPSHRQGIALGSINAAHFTGFMAGPIIGGILAEEIGYRNTFLFSAALLLIAAFMVTFFVREEFQPGEIGERKLSHFSTVANGFKYSWPFLLLLFVMAFARTFDGPIFPLYVQEIHGKLEGAARWTGLIGGISAFGAVLSGIIFGKLADSYSPIALGRICAIAGGIFAVLMGLFPVFYIMIPVRFAISLFIGGMDPIFQAWISRTTDPGQKGTIFGLSTTARSLGWGLSPFLAGWISVSWGIRPAYFFAPVLFLMVIPAIAIAANRTQKNNCRRSKQ